MNARNLLMRGALWIALVRIVVGLIGFVSTIVLARLLVPEDFGLVAIAASIAAVFATLSELTMAEALIQCDEPTDDHFHTAWTLNLLRGLFLALLLTGMAWPISSFYEEPRLFEMMFAFAGANLVGSLISPRLVMFERRLEFRQWLVVSGGEKLAGFVASAGIAFTYQSYWALVIGILASQLMRVVASYILAPYTPKICFSEVKSLLSFSIWLTLNRAVNALNGRADPLLFGSFITPAYLGQFSMGSRISTLAVDETLQPMTQVLFPGLARINHDRERLNVAYLRAQGFLCMIVVPVGAGLAAVADTLVPLVLGEQWLPAADIIKVLAVTAVLSRLIPSGAIAMAIGETRAMFHRSLLTLAIRLPLVIAGLLLGQQHEIGPLAGALSGHALSTSICVWVNINFVRKITGLPVADQVRCIWRPVVATLAMVVAVLCFLRSMPGSDDTLTQVACLGMAIGLGGSVYASMLFLSWRLAGRPTGAESDAISLAGKLVRKVAPL